jgi:hypothetical protein
MFDWDNETWALTWLPRIRLATLLLNRDDVEGEKTMAGIVEDGLAPDLMEGWLKTAKHLEALVETCDAAMTRGYLLLERLGYTPDNPPPDRSAAAVRAAAQKAVH